jgi:urate oxidase
MEVMENRKFEPNILLNLVGHAKLLSIFQSGFEGFVRDRYTLLHDVRERMVATEVTAWWRSDSFMMFRFAKWQE